MSFLVGQARKSRLCNGDTVLPSITRRFISFTLLYFITLSILQRDERRAKMKTMERLVGSVKQGHVNC